MVGHGDDADGGAGTAGLGQSGSAGSAGSLPAGGNSFGGGASGTAGSAGAAGAGGTPNPPPPLGTQQTSGKLDLLLAIDNSTSMADKQELLKTSMPALLQRLVNPFCVDTQGVRAAQQPQTPNDACPAGTNREFAPIRDMHVGVITSSLGSHGGDACNTATNGDDHGQLLPSVRSGVPSYNNLGYLNWDPDARSNPPGQSDITALATDLANTIVAVGESGCGYEAQLESVYRFLVDPEPPLSVNIVNSLSVPQGINETLLAQRASFLRPDSAVAVVMLTDEDDCSIVDTGYGWFVSTRTLPSGTENRMYRSTSACANDPASPCCMSCGDATPPPAQCGMTTAQEDANCQSNPYLTAAEDSVALRCWDQKRRFGFDLLEPLSRYVSGFAGAKVPNQSGALVDNPLFHQGSVTRAPSLFTFSVIAGVPWQDLATSASLTSASSLEYLSADQLTARWPVIAGDPTLSVAPTDPFMLATDLDRTTLVIPQTNPFVAASLVPSTSQNPLANAINGHEQNIASFDDLQYACTFPILPRQCANGEQSCECSPTSSGDLTQVLTYNSPVCNPPGGGATTATQYFAKAYPALRPLWVASQLGPRSVVGSVCARNTSVAAQGDYGYQPSFAAIGRRVAATLAPTP